MINISYIVATFNCADKVCKLHEAAIELHANNCKVFVSDGGSTDGTLDKLVQIKEVEIVSSRPDNGIYDAWNRALAYLPEGYVGFIGVDDTPCQEFIGHAREAVVEVSEPPKIIYGDRLLVRGERTRYLTSPEESALFFSKRPWFDIPHQGCLHSTDLFKEARFDDKLQLAGDLKFLLQHARDMKKSDVLYLPTAQVIADDDGVSRSPNAYAMYAREFEKIENELGIMLRYSKVKLLTFSIIMKIPGVWPLLKQMSWFFRNASRKGDGISV